MKIFSSIFSFYLVLLSILPCCAWDDCPVEKVVLTQRIDQQVLDQQPPEQDLREHSSAGQHLRKQPSAGHQPNDKDCGSCSPFFNCGGCGSVISFHADIYEAALPLRPVIREYARLLTPSLPIVSPEIWQPPQI